MPRGQKQQSMEKTLRPRWSRGGITRKPSSLSVSLEQLLCRQKPAAQGQPERRSRGRCVAPGGCPGCAGHPPGKAALAIA